MTVPEPRPPLLVSLIIPAYNEEGRILLTLRAYLLSMEERWGEDFEIIVVTNNCSDKTPQLVAREAHTHPKLIAVDIVGRIGKGGAVLEGFCRARGRVLIFADADGSTDGESLNRLAEEVLAGADAAIGSRWLTDSVVPLKQPWMRRLASRVFNYTVRLLFGWNIRDTQCGAKAFKAERLQPLLGKIRSRGWTFDVDALWTLQRAYPDAAIREVPVRWSDSSGSRVRLHRDAPGMIWELLKLRFGK